MAFEKFTSTGRGYAPKVSIWSKGQIGINNGAIKRYNLDDCSHAILYYDKSAKRIGISFTKDGGAEGALKFNVRKTGGIIGAKAFLDFYDIDYSTTRKYDFSFSKEADLFVIDL